MAGRGPAPKDAGNRRRFNQPARGEWIELEPLSAPVLPPWRRGFSVPAELWDAWRADPVTGQYSEADIGAICWLAKVFAKLKDNEQRLRMDGLGLTPKGKRDLRWRTPAEVQTIKKTTAQVTRLRVIGKETS
jgi:hypothetical protein